MFPRSKCVYDSFGRHVKVKVDKKICNLNIVFPIFSKKWIRAINMYILILYKNYISVKLIQGITCLTLNRSSEIGNYLKLNSIWGIIIPH